MKFRLSGIYQSEYSAGYLKTGNTMGHYTGHQSKNKVIGTRNFAFGEFIFLWVIKT